MTETYSQTPIAHSGYDEMGEDALLAALDRKLANLDELHEKTTEEIRAGIEILRERAHARRVTLDDLGLSVRAYNVCHNNGWTTGERLSGLSIRAFLTAPGKPTRKLMAEINEALAAHGVPQIGTRREAVDGGEPR